MFLRMKPDVTSFALPPYHEQNLGFQGKPTAFPTLSKYLMHRNQHKDFLRLEGLR